MVDKTKTMSNEGRDPTWEELAVESRVELLRNTVRLLCVSLDTLQRTVEKLSEHKHVDGDIVVPISLKEQHLSLNWQWLEDRLK